ncbi:MAG: cytochrome c biogenesis protein CcdA [Candidatus Sulfotelmatobacter sp.]
MSTLPLPIAAFFGGLVSFLSPCVLPLVPGYVSLISSVGVQELRSQESQSLRKVMLNSVAFILGFSIVFIALGAISTEVGQLLAQYKSTLARLAGVVSVILGFHLSGIFRINVRAQVTQAQN